MSEAGRLWIRSVAGLRIGVLAIAEAEYSVAGFGGAGANPMDAVKASRTLREARGACDFLLVLVHGGNEHLEIPRPGLRDFCRWMVEEGARLVVCQHSHCVGTYERYQSGLIVYGQGNLLFADATARPTWRLGALLAIQSMGHTSFSHEFVPFQLRASGSGVEGLSELAAATVLKAFEARSLVLRSEKAYVKEWRQFCEGRRWAYLSMMHGFGRLSSRLNRHGLLTRLMYTKSQLRTIGNIIRCDSHREVLTTLAELDLVRDRVGGDSLGS